MSAFKLVLRKVLNMNLESIYMCHIYVKIREINHGITEENGKRFVNIESVGEAVKHTLVFKKQNTVLNAYIDLETGEEYTKFDVVDARVGEMFINISEGMIPASKIIEHKRNNMSKRKILKKYNEIKNGGKKE